MGIRHSLLHRSRYVSDCSLCDLERSQYAALDRAMERVIPQMNAMLADDGSAFRLGFLADIDAAEETQHLKGNA